MVHMVQLHTRLSTHTSLSNNDANRKLCTTNSLAAKLTSQARSAVRSVLNQLSLCCAPSLAAQVGQ